MPVQWTQEQLAEISKLQEQRNLTRKGAAQFYTRQQKKVAPADTKAAPKASKRAKSCASVKKESNKGSVSSGLLAAELREGVVKKMWTKHSAGEIAVALGWAPGNGYGMVKRIALGLGLRRK